MATFQIFIMARQPDLFPDKAPSGPLFDQTKVAIELHLHRQSALAWLLSKTGMERDAKWLPKSVAVRSDRFPTVFTLSRSAALEKGFL